MEFHSKTSFQTNGWLFFIHFLYYIVLRQLLQLLEERIYQGQKSPDCRGNVTVYPPSFPAHHPVKNILQRILLIAVQMIAAIQSTSNKRVKNTVFTCWLYPFHLNSPYKFQTCTNVSQSGTRCLTRCVPDLERSSCSASNPAEGCTLQSRSCQAPQTLPVLNHNLPPIAAWLKSHSEVRGVRHGCSKYGTYRAWHR